jgi:periplasmic copper chaperone A
MMSRSKRRMSMPGASVAVALSLSLGAAGAVAASDDERSMEAMASPEPLASMAPGLYVQDAWTRESPMLDLAGAAYMIIRNDTDSDDALIGASSPQAEVVELHLSSMDDEGMMSMAQVQEIPVPAHDDAVLKPGSYHIMLIGLLEPLTEGTDVEINLEFMTAEPQAITAPVLAEPPTSATDMDMHDDSMDDSMHAAGDDMDDQEAQGEEDEEDS